MGEPTTLGNLSLFFHGETWMADEIFPKPGEEPKLAASSYVAHAEPLWHKIFTSFSNFSLSLTLPITLIARYQGHAPSSSMNKLW
jgi:hypothetical protein